MSMPATRASSTISSSSTSRSSGACRARPHRRADDRGCEPAVDRGLPAQRRACRLSRQRGRRHPGARGLGLPRPRLRWRAIDRLSDRRALRQLHAARRGGPDRRVLQLGLAAGRGRRRGPGRCARERARTAGAPRPALRPPAARRLRRQADDGPTATPGSGFEAEIAQGMATDTPPPVWRWAPR
jgi:hypothetical protein